MLHLLNLASYQRTLQEIRHTSTSSFVLYYAVVVGFCALMRCLVLNRIRDCPLRPRLLEAITCAEQYACWLGHLRVAAVYGADIALMALAAASVYRWMTQCPGTTVNPLSYMLAFVVRQCSMTVEEMCNRVAIQVGCALVSHSVASVVWQQSMLGRHPAGVVAALHCGHPDTEVDAAVIAAAQFFSVLVLGIFTLRYGSVVVDLFEMIGQLLINAMLLAAGYNDTFSSNVAIYLNPLISLTQLATCLNREVVAHLVLYWLISISAVLLVAGGCCCGCCSPSDSSLDHQRRGDVDNSAGQARQPRPASRGPQQQRTGEQGHEQPGGKTASKSSHQHTRDHSGEQSHEQPGGKTASKSSHQHTRDHSKEETAQQQQQQQENEGKKEKKEKKEKKSSHHESRMQDDRHSVKKTKSNASSTKRSRSSGNSQMVDDELDDVDDEEDQRRQSGKVVCGYETPRAGTADQCCGAAQQWHCRVTTSQNSDTKNRSVNACNNDDDDDDDHISALLRAFQTSQLENTRHSVDKHAVSADRATAGQCRYARAASCADNRRTTNRLAEDNALIVTRSSTRETDKQHTTSDSRWTNYYEDRCSAYNDSDEGDHQP